MNTLTSSSNSKSGGGHSNIHARFSEERPSHSATTTAVSLSGMKTSGNSSASGNSSNKKSKYGKPKLESHNNPYLHGGSLKNIMSKNED
jgi:hypothetical protein